MRFVIAHVAFCFTFIASAQSIQIYNLDASAYPTVKADFYAFDRNDERNTSLSKNDISIQVDGEPRRVISVTHPEPTDIVKLSVVFVMDISGSMGSNNNIGLARAGASAFIDQMCFTHSDAAIVSFESSAYIESGFTSDKSRLQKAVSRLKPSGGTSYDQAFNHEFSGGMSLASETSNSPVVIFLTDGQGSVDPQTVINKASTSRTRVYTVCLNMKTPESLQKIADGTNGMSFGNVSSEKEIQNIYSLIYRNVSGLKPSQITWAGENSCKSTSKILMLQKSNQLKSNELPFERTGAQTKRLSFNPIVLEFDPEAREQTLEVKASNGDINISDISTSLDFIKLEGASTGLLKSGQKLSIKTTLNKEPDKYEFGKVSIKNNCADVEVLTMVQSANASGVSTMHVDFPNGGEEFISGTPSTWKWSGGGGAKSIDLTYSLDNGASWEKIKAKGKNNELSWDIPPVNSKQVLFKVEPEKARKSDKLEKGVIKTINIQERLRPENQIYMSPLGNQLYGFSKSAPKVKDALTGQDLWSKAGVKQIKYSLDGAHLFVKLLDGTVEKYDAQSFSKVAGRHQFPRDPAPSSAIKASKSNSTGNGKYFVSYDLDGDGRVYDPATGEELMKLKESGYARDQNHMTLTYDGKVMAFGKKGIAIFDIETGKTIFEFDRKYVSGSVAPNGRFAVLGYKDNKGNRRADVFSLTGASELIGDQSDQVFTIISPEFDVENAAFSQVEVGRGDDKFFTNILKNKSDVIVELESVTLAGGDASSFSVISGNGPKQIDKLKNADIEFNFTPQREGKHEATILVKTNYGTYQRTITGEGIAPKLSFSSKDINLGKHKIGALLDSVLANVLSNGSKEDVMITKMELISADDDQFTLNKTESILKKKGVLSLDVTFKAIRRGKTSARVQIHSPQLVRPATVSIFAEVVAPKVYDIKLITKSTTTRQPLKHKFTANISAAGEKVLKESTNDGKLDLNLQADLLYDIKFDLEEGEQAEKKVDLKKHRSEKEIEIIVWINDEVKTDLPDIIYAGDLLDETTSKKIKGKIVIAERSGMRLDSIEGKAYTFTLSKSKEVKFFAKAPGYLPKAVPVESLKSPKPNSHVLDIELTPVVLGTAIQLENVLFHRGKSTLVDGSDEQLNLLIDYLIDNAGSKIELAGHTDNQGSAAANYKLSNERVETIKTYLIENGIDKKRLSGKGYGPSQPIASNKTEATRQLNRRVEFKLVE